MGNFAASPLNSKEAFDVSTPQDYKKLKLVDIDPRSPTDGILRTPIIFNKQAAGDCQFNLEGINVALPFDTSDFESIDGCVTEDDSLHHIDNSSIDLSHQHKSEANLKNGPIARIRRSLMSGQRGKSSHANSPSMFVRLRQKQNVEQKKREEEQQQTNEDDAAASSDKENNCSPGN